MGLGEDFMTHFRVSRQRMAEVDICYSQALWETERGWEFGGRYGSIEGCGGLGWTSGAEGFR